MGVTEIVWYLGGFVASILVAAGYALLSLTPTDFRNARRCFWAAAICMGVMGIMWNITTEQPLLTRVAIMGLIGALTLALLSEALRWVSKREKEAQSPISSTSVPQISSDYAYGLAFSGLQPSLDTGNQVNRLEIRLLLQNKVDGPLKFRLEKMVTSIGGYDVITENKEATIAKGDPVTFFPSGGLTGKQYLSIASRSTGQLDATILYGHPDRGFVRRMSLSLHLDFFKKKTGTKNETVSVNWVIQKQSEEPISETSKP